jgi:hypothetical protein
MAESRLGDVNYVGIELSELVVTQSPAFHYPGAEVFKYNIGDGYELSNNVQAPRCAYVKSEAQLIAVGIIEIAGRIEIDLNALGSRKPAASPSLILRPLHFDDLGS